MKKIFKRLVCLLCTVTLALGLSAGAFAAAVPYAVSVSGTQVLVKQGTKTVGSYKVKTADLTLSTNKTGTLVLGFKDSDSKKRSISLGTQTALTVGGTMASLTLDKTLSASLTIAPKSSISSLTVHSPTKVTVANDAKLAKLSSSNKAATIKNTSGKTLTAASVKAPATAATPAKKPATTPAKQPATGSSATGLKLTTKPIGADRGDSLSDLLDKLNENVTARDAANDYVLGECKWNNSGNGSIYEDCTMGFTFYPDEADYEPTKGSIKIYADGNTEEITITLQDYTQSNPLLISEDTKLSELTSDVKDSIYVENDNGDSIDYTFKWNSGSSTKFTSTDRMRGYSFTVTPKSSRYAKEEGTIYIKGQDAP